MGRAKRTLIAAVIVSGMVLPSPVAGACAKAYEHAYDEAVPQRVARGITTTIRTSNAIDWQDPGTGGHVGVHLWVATDGFPILDGFVEVFVIDGKYPGTGSHRRFFGAAQWIYPESDIDLRYFTLQPVVGESVTLIATYDGSGAYRATYNMNGSTGNTHFSNTYPSTDEVEAGVESTHQCNRQDRAYITDVQIRRDSDGVWQNINNQSLHDDVYAKVGPCSNDTQFRAWINSQTSTVPCF
jgi:hypothetical protein